MFLSFQSVQLTNCAVTMYGKPAYKQKFHEDFKELGPDSRYPPYLCTYDMVAQGKEDEYKIPKNVSKIILTW
jgi:hypothetical protein